jgi:nucleotide-binding universal stress UspA family protein
MQDPRSILVHLDATARTARRVEVARQLAEAFDAQVTGVPCTMPALLRYPYAVEAGADAVAAMRQLDGDRRDAMHAAFVAASAGSPAMHWTEPMKDAPWGLSRRALYADLLVLGQRDPDDPVSTELAADFVPGLLADCGRPGLVLPHSGAIRPIGQKILLAWKPTEQAARAVSAALPWLRGAHRVHAVAFGDEADNSLRSLRVYLAQQSVSAEIHAAGPDEGDTGELLLSMAAHLGADLLVMGCYGHTRAREWLLGGVTRTVLQTMTLPVLMAH